MHVMLIDIQSALTCNHSLIHSPIIPHQNLDISEYTLSIFFIPSGFICASLSVSNESIENRNKYAMQCSLTYI